MHATLGEAKSGEIELLHPAPPEPGDIHEIAPGFLWLRMPLPFILNHVNIWLLNDGDGWTIIDAAADKPVTREIWDRVLARDLAGERISRLICTHGHPDHVGLAGWLCERLDVRLHMTLGEWLAPQVWREQGLKPMGEGEIRFFRDNGVAETDIERMKSQRENAQFRNYPLPTSFQRIRDGETLRFGKQSWKVLVNGGHADEHASFYSSRAGILIAGDQILSKITPVVGVFPSQPTANPLADYMASLKRLAKLPDDTLVLPSHGLPFRGLRRRIAQMEAHHEKRLAKLEEVMTKPKTGVELAAGLFERAMAEGQLIMALAETLAHAHYLVSLRRARRVVGKDGRVTFSRG